MPADLNSDGDVDSFDLSILLSNWGTADANSDLNSDGTVDSFDLSTLLSEWGPVSPSQEVVYRVNSGSIAVSGAPMSWAEDTNTNPSDYLTSTNTGDYAPAGVTITQDSSVPAGTPSELFESYRYDSNNADGYMVYDFPVAQNADHTVRLYFAEIFDANHVVGGRTFDATINGTTVLSSYDIFADVGADTGVMKEFNVSTTTESNINITLGPASSDASAVSAIEILSTAPVPAVPPSAPTGMAATAGDSQVSLSWGSVTAAETYTIYRSTTSGSGYAAIQSDLTSTSHIDTTVANDSTYYYVVTASNTNGESANSSEVSATPAEAASPDELDPTTYDIMIGSAGIVGQVETSTDGASWTQKSWPAAISELESTPGKKALIVDTRAGGSVFKEMEADFSTDGVTLLGDPSAASTITFDGSRTLSGWTSGTGGYWVDVSFTPGVEYPTSQFDDNTYPSGYNDHKAEVLLVDGARWRHRSSKPSSTGEYWIDYGGGSGGSHRVWVFNNPAGSEVKLSVKRWFVAGRVDDVTLQNLRVCCYSTSTHHGAIGGGNQYGNATHGGGSADPPKRWTYQYVECDNNGGLGVALSHDHVVQHCNFHSNGQCGWWMNMADEFNNRKTTSFIENSRFAENCLIPTLRVEWEGGTGKLTTCYGGSTFKNNLIEDERGGPWWDWWNYGLHYTSNMHRRITETWALFYEVSLGYAGTKDPYVTDYRKLGDGGRSLIAWNQFEDCFTNPAIRRTNTGGAMRLHSSRDVDVVQNLVTNSWRAFGYSFQGARDGTPVTEPGLGGNVNILTKQNDYQVIDTDGSPLLFISTGTNGLINDAGIEFDGDVCRVPSLTGDYYRWDGGAPAPNQTSSQFDSSINSGSNATVTNNPTHTTSGTGSPGSGVLAGDAGFGAPKWWTQEQYGPVN